MKRKAAVFTRVLDEKLFLPIWLKYYSKHFEMEDIYVLDHYSTDGSTSDLGCNVRLCGKGPHALRFPPNTLLEVVMPMQRKLLESYDTVLYTDADEIVFPKHCDLREYIERFDRETVRCTGYEVYHRPDEGEPPYDPNKLILEQRRFWWKRAAYDKPLLSRIPLVWYTGFHSSRQNLNLRVSNYKGATEGYRDDNLILLHLHRMDKDLAFARRRWRWTLKSPISEREKSEEELSFWWIRDVIAEPIPDDIPKVV